MLAIADEVETDVEAFEESAAAARAGHAVAAYRTALDAFAGELLPEDRYEAFEAEPAAETRALYRRLLAGNAAVTQPRTAPPSRSSSPAER